MAKFSKRSLQITLAAFMFLTVGSIVGKRYLRKIDLSVVGYINMADGLGRQGPELVEAFKDTLCTKFHMTRNVKGGKKPKGFKKHIAKSNNKWGKVVIFEDILWEPNGKNHTDILAKCPSKSIKIAYSMWESTRLPAEWVQILNHRFDAVVVPSEFLVEAYEKSGVKTPIFVVPLALDFKEFFEQPLKDKPDEVFVFGNLSAAVDRKNHPLLIRAFHKAFGHDPSVKLILNARTAEKDVRCAITKELARADAQNIEYIQKKLSSKDYLKKYQSFDCYVSPSKGEGFSIQPREAMALGIPVVATNNTGQVDICETGLVKVVKTPIAELAINPWGEYYGYNFNCNVDDLAEALIDMRNNYESYLANGAKARQWAKRFEFSELVSLYASLIQPKKVVFGSTNEVTADCMTTNSLKLLKKYQKAFGKEICKCENEAVFSWIYETGEWGVDTEGQGFSGAGSTLEAAEPYMNLLTAFMKDNQITSVVDLGCGDWTFSKHMCWEGIDYTGIDVVNFVIDQNQKQHSAPNIKFIHADGVGFDLPGGDLLICKDVMQHLSNTEVKQLLTQLKKYKHCLLTNDIETDPNKKVNRDIPSGHCRCLDLTKPPFNLDGSRLLEYEANGTTKVVLHINND